MNTERLLRLADHLEQVVALKPEQFDMWNWSENDATCGTVACAVGHACSLPEFRAAGLDLVWPAPAAGSAYRTAIPAIRAAEGSVVVEGVAAVQEFFGLTEDEVDDLFTPEGYYDDPVWCCRLEAGESRRWWSLLVSANSSEPNRDDCRRPARQHQTRPHRRCPRRGRGAQGGGRGA